MSDWREEYEKLPEVREYRELVKRVLDKPSLKLQIAVWLLVILGLASLPFILYGLHLLGVIG